MRGGGGDSETENKIYESILQEKQTDVNKNEMFFLNCYSGIFYTKNIRSMVK